MSQAWGDEQELTYGMGPCQTMSGKERANCKTCNRGGLLQDRESPDPPKSAGKSTGKERGLLGKLLGGNLLVEGTPPSSPYQQSRHSPWHFWEIGAFSVLWQAALIPEQDVTSLKERGTVLRHCFVQALAIYRTEKKLKFDRS